MKMTKEYAKQALEFLKRHEGFSPHLYKDSVGKWTIGYGRNLEDDPLHEYEAEFLLMQDIERLDKALSLHEAYQALDNERKAIILDMAYNLGYGGLMKFTHLWQALEKQDYEQAAKEMLNSEWAEEVKSRATELAQLMDSSWVQDVR
ncbi:glycoside hydrolase family protein [Coxiella burnetii]|uniref:glycoside hydrolase family protein n=1 Tax=Coxiella burnetii TaxID=777 RepID=UPI000183CFE6|nr:glycoside hydrolase family protein [Coxiella burnetii]ACJ20056.1 lysozyme [Coxiella burnetii CbuK_Q154]EAX33701.2 lysozyme [Coxiella burnetii 'MSU Goat Q177']